MLSYRPTHEWARNLEVRLKTCSDRYSLFVKIAYSSRTTDLETAISGCTTSVRTMCWAGSSAWYARQRPKNVRFARYSARGTGRSRVRIPPGPPTYYLSMLLHCATSQRTRPRISVMNSVSCGRKWGNQWRKPFRLHHETCIVRRICVPP